MLATSLQTRWLHCCYEPGIEGSVNVSDLTRASLDDLRRMTPSMPPTAPEDISGMARSALQVERQVLETVWRGAARSRREEPEQDHSHSPRVRDDRSKGSGSTAARSAVSSGREFVRRIAHQPVVSFLGPTTLATTRGSDQDIAYLTAIRWLGLTWGRTSADARVEVREREAQLRKVRERVVGPDVSLVFRMIHRAITSDGQPMDQSGDVTRWPADVETDLPAAWRQDFGRTIQRRIQDLYQQAHGDEASRA